MSANYPPIFHDLIDSASAFEKVVEVTFTRGSESVDLSNVTGSITADRRRAMRWNGSVTIPVDIFSELLPTTPNDLLTPFGTLAAVRLGVRRYDDTTALVPYGAFMVDASAAEMSADSRSVTLPLIDLARRIADYRFETPFRVAAGVDVATAVNTVIEDRTGFDPELDPTGDTLARGRWFGNDPNKDPWTELLKMCRSRGYTLYYDRGGSLVLDPIAEPDPATTVPLGGRLTVAIAFDRRPANVVVVRGEASDNTSPIQRIAMDEDDSSPTFAGANPGESAYGRVTRFFSSPQITTGAQANNVAKRMLRRELAISATWTVTKAYDPQIDPGDVYTIQLDENQNAPLVVDAVTVDLGGTTTVYARQIIDPDSQAEAEVPPE